MLYYFLMGLIFLTHLSLPIKLEDFSNLELFFNQEEVLEIRIKSELESISPVNSPPIKTSESLGIHTTAKAAIVVDVNSGAVLFQKEPEKQLSIASITKLMTALVFLENNPGFEQVAQIGSGENNLEGARLFVKDNEQVKLEDLFYSSLVGSTNNTTQALVHATGLTGEEFVEKMNTKALALGMKNTHFIEPTGLDNENVSTVKDLVKLTKAAFSIPKIQEATTLKDYSLITVSNQELHTVKSQNELLDSYLNLTGTKTGFTYDAGYCLIVQAKNKSGNEVIAAVLGSESNDARFQETKALVSWVFDNFRWE